MNINALQNRQSPRPSHAFPHGPHTPAATQMPETDPLQVGPAEMLFGGILTLQAHGITAKGHAK